MCDTVTWREKNNEQRKWEMKNALNNHGSVNEGSE